MVRVKPSPTRSAPQTGNETWNGTLFILSNSPPFDLPEESTAPSPTESPPPSSFALTSSSDKRYLPWDQRRGGTAHPLHGHQGLEPFNDMQVLIIDAIAEVGEPATFDQILQLVSSRWRGIKIRRRDGTPYTTDCRRAIQANLRTNPHQVSLFIRVEQPDGGVAWRFSRCIEEAEEAKIKSKTEKSKETKPGDSSLPQAGAKASGGDGEAHSRSDEESAPPSPEPLESGRSMRPIRSTRVASVFEDALLTDSDEEIAANAPHSSGVPSSSASASASGSTSFHPSASSSSQHHHHHHHHQHQHLHHPHGESKSRPSSSQHTHHHHHHKRPNRQDSASPLGSSEDEYSTRKQGVRRDYEDESDMPPAKRSLLINASSASDGSSVLAPSPSSTPSASYDWNSSPSSSSATSFDISSAMLAMMQTNSQMTTAADNRFPPGGWIPHVYAYPYASPSPSSSYPSTGVPTFLPHQMSLAHEHAQKLASSPELLSPAFGNWTDRSTQSRHSFSSGGSSLGASTSTLPDPSPRMPLSQRSAPHATLLSPSSHHSISSSSHPHSHSHSSHTSAIIMGTRASLTETSFGDVASSH